MFRFTGLRWHVVALLMVGLIGLLPRGSVNAGGEPKVVRIGIANTFFTDRGKEWVNLATDDFKKVLKDMTGLTGDLITKHGVFEVAEKLHDKQVDFGFWHGHEFAWVQQKYPDLQPLLIAFNKDHEVRAYLIVHKDNSAKTLADLRGKKFGMPAPTKETCRVFVERLCLSKAGKEPAVVFGQVVKPESQEDALDEIALRNLDATVVDEIGLAFYKRIKGPVFEKNLRVFEASAPFPRPVICYKPGGVSNETLTRFRDGLLKAHTTESGRDMMKTWKITSFESATKDYAKSLAESLKAYPAPMQVR